jgi:hypothetical protein
LRWSNEDQQLDEPHLIRERQERKIYAWLKTVERGVPDSWLNYLNYETRHQKAVDGLRGCQCRDACRSKLR